MTTAQLNYKKRVDAITYIVDTWESKPAADLIIKLMAEVHEDGFNEGCKMMFNGFKNAPSRNRSLYEKGLLSLKRWRAIKEFYKHRLNFII